VAGAEEREHTENINTQPRIDDAQYAAERVADLVKQCLLSPTEQSRHEPLCQYTDTQGNEQGHNKTAQPDGLYRPIEIGLCARPQCRNRVESAKIFLGQLDKTAQPAEQ